MNRLVVKWTGWVRTRLSTGTSRNQAGEARKSADRARDQGQWQEAAAFYRVYLKTFPNNADIWIQLGNMCKESLLYEAAVQAYERALLLQPDDPEGHIQLGHLWKRRGVHSRAADHYVKALSIDARSATTVELALRETVGRLTTGEQDEPIRAAPIVREELQARGINVEIVEAQGITTRFDENTIELFGNDPRIEFRLAKDDEVRFGLLRFDVEWTASDDYAPPSMSVYMDYGKGYSENLKINLDREDGFLTELLIAGPSAIRAVRWDPDIKPNSLKLLSIEYRPLRSSAEVETWLARHPHQSREDALAASSTEDFLSLKTVTAEDAMAMQYDLPIGFSKGFNQEYWNRKYLEWNEKYIDPSDQDYIRMAGMIDDFSVQPKFSFVMPVYNPPIDLLEQCIDSMIAQNYPNFEICIADDCSPNPKIPSRLLQYAADNPRIKVEIRQKNGHISSASNSALSLADGDFIVLVDHDDLIPDFALFVACYYINKNKNAKIIYSDEDKIDIDGVRSMPYFKGKYNKFLLFGHNMISHLGIYRRDIVENVGGFRLGFEGSQDYDLFLRCFDQVEEAEIVHIPHVLYHWRAIPGSTAVSADQKGYAIVAAEAAINGYFERSGIPFRSVDGFAPGCTAIKSTKEYRTSISIIIPTKDGLDVLKPCIESILATKPQNCEIIVVDNGSELPETLEFLENLAIGKTVVLLRYPQEFNFSLINNFAAEHASGEILCFLNNDTEVLAANWLGRARALMALPEVGMVGARLLFPDGGVQHFGVVLGMGGHRVAGTPHAGLPAHLPGYFGKNRLIQEFSAVTAACMFIRKSDFTRIGGFDPDFRVAYNDIDLCMRLRETGLKIVCDPDIELVHKESRTRGSDREGARARRLDDEAALMHSRWGQKLLNDPYYSPNVSLDRVDFALAYPPRVAMPWRRSGGCGEC